MIFLGRNLSDPANVARWTNAIKPIVRRQFDNWCESDEPVPLFNSISQLVLTVSMYMFMGPSFTERHAAELCLLLGQFEEAVQSPFARALPKWLSKDAQVPDYVDKRFKETID